MRLVITDTGFVWNQNNPFLEEYKDIVLVVCLYGKAVTDQYECFVSPFDQKTDIRMGMDRYGIEDRKFQKLASVGEKLNEKLGDHEKIVFLTDNEPSTLYPFYVLKEWSRYHSLHLVAMPPWRFESSGRRKGYHSMLSDLTLLSSILYYDSDKILEILGMKTTFSEAAEYITNDLGKMMPSFLNGIRNMCSGPCYFDFASMAYIPLKGEFDDKVVSHVNDGMVSDRANNDGAVSDRTVIDRTVSDRTINDGMVSDVKNHVTRKSGTLGVVCRPLYPEDSERVKEEVERLPARLDGKKICDVLRRQRIRLARANNIPFASMECPYIGPCAGTCEKCDAESEYVREQMRKIPEEKRIYPPFDPGGEVRV